MATDTFGTRDFFELFNIQGDADVEILIDKGLMAGLDVFKKAKNDTLARFKVGGTADTPVVRWGEEDDYPDAITATLATTTLTISGYLFGKALATDSEAVDLCKQVLRVGTILQRPTDGVQAKVTSIAGLVAAGSLAVTVAAYGNTSLSDDSGAVTWYIISEPWYDSRNVEQPRALTWDLRSVGTQIFEGEYEILKTTKFTKFELVSNKVEHQIVAQLRKLRQELAKSIIHGRPYHDGTDYRYMDYIRDPTMCGILTWPEIVYAETGSTANYYTNSNKVLQKSTLNTVIRRMWTEMGADFSSGNWKIVTDPIVFSQIQTWDQSYRRIPGDQKKIGWTVHMFDSDVGKEFEIVQDELYLRRPGCLSIMDFSKNYYGYFNGDKMDRTEIPLSTGRAQQWQLSFQTYGVVNRNPRATNTLIYNIKTS